MSVLAIDIKIFLRNKKRKKFQYVREQYRSLSEEEKYKTIIWTSTM